MRKIILFILLNSCLFAQMSPLAANKIKSLVLPGLGQHAMGNEKRANSFFIREAALWFICIGGKKMASWHESNYKAFAELHADVNMEGKDYIFSVNLGHYDSMDEYNANMARKRKVNEMYAEDSGNDWEWDKTSNRIYFDRMRINSVKYGKYAQFAIGGLILHRIISFIDIIYLERKISIIPTVSSSSASLQLSFSLDDWK